MSSVNHPFQRGDDNHNSLWCYHAHVSWRWTYSVLGDLVREIEYVDPNGDLQKITDTRLLTAGVSCLGLLGPVVSLTLELLPMSYATLRPHVCPLYEGIPTADLAEESTYFRADCNSYYTEWFWFPGAGEKMWINCWETMV